jgi:hypothetical protein
MTRFLATIAILGTFLAAPAWAETMTTKSHQPASHAVHHAAPPHARAMTEARPRHHFVTGDDHAEMLNRQALQGYHNGS